MFSGKIRCRMSKDGSILIFALWGLGMLVVFAAITGLTIRQRIHLAFRVESRQHLRDLVSSGIKQGIAALERDIQRQSGFYNVENKVYRHNNPESFPWVTLNQGAFQVSYPFMDERLGFPGIRPGLIDEESKLNVNFATRDELFRLLGAVTAVSDDDAARIVDGILGWRSFGDADQEGFYSQDFYLNLEQPYAPKKADFEVFEELLLVQGMTPQVYDQLLPYVTIYGDGLVNINNASPSVLAALGMADSLIDKFLEARRGPDAVEATMDDHIFLRTYDIATEVHQIVALKPEEIQQIDLLNALQKVKTESAFFRIQSRGRLEYRPDGMDAMAVYNAIDRWIEYYREK